MRFAFFLILGLSNQGLLILGFANPDPYAYAPVPYRLPRESKRYASTDQRPLSTSERERGSRLYFQNYAPSNLQTRFSFRICVCQTTQIYQRDSEDLLIFGWGYFFIFYFENLDQAIFIKNKLRFGIGFGIDHRKHIDLICM